MAWSVSLEWHSNIVVSVNICVPSLRRNDACPVASKLTDDSYTLCTLFAFVFNTVYWSHCIPRFCTKFWNARCYVLSGPVKIVFVEVENGIFTIFFLTLNIRHGMIGVPRGKYACEIKKYHPVSVKYSSSLSGVRLMLNCNQRICNEIYLIYWFFFLNAFIYLYFRVLRSYIFRFYVFYIFIICYLIFCF